MKRSLFVLPALLLAFACGTKDADKPAPAAAKPAQPEPTKPPVEPAKPAEPAAAVYSPEAAAKLIADLEKCEYDFNCEAYKPLVGFGAKVAPDLAKLAVDPVKPAKARSIAAKALGEIKDPAQGKALFDAAKAEQDFMLRGELYAAAGASGSDEVLAAAGALYLTDEGWEQRTEVRKALLPFGKKAFAWASAELPKAKEKFKSALADVVADTATAEDLPALQALIKSTKEEMALDRLAAAAIALGDGTQVEVLFTNLGSDDGFVRMDAAMQLGGVAEKLTPEQKAKGVELVKAAQAKASPADQGYFDGPVKDLSK